MLYHRVSVGMTLHGWRCCHYSPSNIYYLKVAELHHIPTIPQFLWFHWQWSLHTVNIHYAIPYVLCLYSRPTFESVKSWCELGNVWPSLYCPQAEKREIVKRGAGRREGWEECIGGLGQEQRGRFMASWHFFWPVFLPVSLEQTSSVRLSFFHLKGLWEGV